MQMTDRETTLHGSVQEYPESLALQQAILPKNGKFQKILLFLSMKFIVFAVCQRSC